MANLKEDIYNTFKEYYGETRVDAYETDGYYTIFIHWPTCVVTNERNESTTIYDLYSKIQLYDFGRLVANPLFIRSTYTKLQWESGYRHSHLPGLYNKSDFATWVHGCLGTGPIRTTLNNLGDSSSDKYKDLMEWTRLAWELDKYVHVESLRGGPYIRISNIGTGNSRYYAMNINSQFSHNFSQYIPDNVMIDFIKYLLQKDILQWGYTNGNYILAMSDSKVIKGISDTFIQWFNEGNHEKLEYSVLQLYNAKVLDKVILVGDEIYSKLNTNTNSHVAQESSSLGFTFKNRVVKLSITGIPDPPINITILNRGLICYIVSILVYYVNIYYGNTDEKINKTRCLLSNDS